jgi:hypothetical protein
VLEKPGREGRTGQKERERDGGRHRKREMDTQGSKQRGPERDSPGRSRERRYIERHRDSRF